MGRNARATKKLVIPKFLIKLREWFLANIKTYSSAIERRKIEPTQSRIDRGIDVKSTYPKAKKTYRISGDFRDHDKWYGTEPCCKRPMKL
jgi:hypothetical protein